jgi:hypothetical protein
MDFPTEKQTPQQPPLSIVSAKETAMDANVGPRGGMKQHVIQAKTMARI